MASDVQGTTPGAPSLAATEPADRASGARPSGPAAAEFARLVEGFNRSRRPGEIVRAMLDDGVALLGGRLAALYVLSEAGDELVVTGAAGLPPDALVGRFDRIPLSSELPAAEVVRTGEPVIVTSPADRRDRYPDLDRLPIEFDPAFIVVPLKDALGRPFGAMAVGFRSGTDVTGSGRRDLIEHVAAQCALALDRARLADSIERDQDHLAFLDELSATLSSSLQIDTALSQLAAMAVPRIADWCVVRLTASPGAPRPLIGAAHVDRPRSGRSPGWSSGSRATSTPSASSARRWRPAGPGSGGCGPPS